MSSDARAGIREAVRTLEPGYFALVMATGIVSTATCLLKLHALSAVLLWIAGIAYAVLVAGNVARITLFGNDFRADLADPERSFTVFTFVAATDVLGARLLLDGHVTPAGWLAIVGGVAWLVLGYLIPWTAVLSHPDQPALSRVNGTWFLAVVAAQSVAVMAAGLQPLLGDTNRPLALLAVLCWSVGVFLYAAAGMLVALRMLTYPVSAQELTPPYWIAMGATAITVFAGARIVQMADTPVVVATRGLIAGVAVLFFAFGTWLIPVLIAAGFWRHLVRRVPLRYNTALWSMVFPLGMYGVAGHYLGRADGLPALTDIGDLASWIALGAWVLTFLAMCGALAAKARGTRGLSRTDQNAPR
ncbi:tellurite resistance/C4-dicarboxylate transporter family protein [Mycolicibacterium llatzerense]|uniref:tellurite resistance/C4-dicarboxylate transporter family protein n=1 Tax=Mycolicibacterium llatzerense TaxID=280871 RepID=UPI0021B5FB90|nr:tellurite resistance/C4-dicarboxylate transporter family protein [Mycolicibacterium llatzerense]MCT7363582.1 tellurite resistance protein permease [Mycolicibacterium llatzerense]MCT7367754.1 tellurite resistance protein permease [Mycolicibacterium llatzerense]